MTARTRDRPAAEEVAKTSVPMVSPSTARAGGEGRLFGSITASDIADAVDAQTGFEIDRQADRPRRADQDRGHPPRAGQAAHRRRVPGHDRGRRPLAHPTRRGGAAGQSSPPRPQELHLGPEGRTERPAKIISSPQLRSAPSSPGARSVFNPSFHGSSTGCSAGGSVYRPTGRACSWFSMSRSEPPTRSPPGRPPVASPPRPRRRGVAARRHDARQEAIANAAGHPVRRLHKPAHAHIYDAVHTLYGAGQPVDPSPWPTSCAGPACSTPSGPPAPWSSSGATPATTNAGRYARIVEEHALLRRLIGTRRRDRRDRLLDARRRHQGLGPGRDARLRHQPAQGHQQHHQVDELLGLNLDRLEQLYGRATPSPAPPPATPTSTSSPPASSPTPSSSSAPAPPWERPSPSTPPPPHAHGVGTMGDDQLGDQVLADDGAPSRSHPVHRSRPTAAATGRARRRLHARRRRRPPMARPRPVGRAGGRGPTPARRCPGADHPADARRGSVRRGWSAARRVPARGPPLDLPERELPRRSLCDRLVAGLGHPATQVVDVAGQPTICSSASSASRCSISGIQDLLIRRIGIGLHGQGKRSGA